MKVRVPVMLNLFQYPCLLSGVEVQFLQVLQNLSNQRTIQNLERKVLFAQIFQRCTDVVQNSIIDYQKSVVHFRRVLHGQRRVLRIEFLHVLRGELCFWVGLNRHVHAALLLFVEC